ncbi:hypothetical protein [[Mycoplasma] mobile]|uniref:Expressed putative lipoprotein n=1 Tax=Mycoplasma mobile (strain ATCC 43663 / 163K / NCTC 11711) TaxID=267748 RepID=Q6KIT2_MYCM1|nr:hypothetical protein [[Mycoplasma] mobile]AAT27492.1 expressed putative lipoprotein [Mycoplasma mobile 163K]
MKLRKKLLFSAELATIGLIPITVVSCSISNPTKPVDPVTPPVDPVKPNIISTLEEVNLAIKNNNFSLIKNNITNEFNNLLPSQINIDNFFKNINFENDKNITKDSFDNFEFIHDDLNGKLEVIFEKNEIQSDKLILLGFKTEKLNQMFEIKTSSDQFVLTNEFYSGRINVEGNPRFKTLETTDNNKSIMMGKGDALVLVFDNVEDTEESMKTFIQNLFFTDTAIASGVIKKQEEMNPNNFIGRRIRFNTNSLSTSYYGSQHNRSLPGKSIQESFKEIENTFSSPEIFAEIIKQWGYVKNEDGSFSKDPSIRNPLNEHFHPSELINKDTWKINQVSQNAFSFTFNSNITSITFADIARKDGEKSFTRMTPRLSLGKPIEWNAYLRNGNAQVLGQKINSFVNLDTLGQNVTDYLNDELQSFNDIIFNNLKIISNASSPVILDEKSMNFIKNYLDEGQSALVITINNEIYIRVKTISENKAITTFKNTFLPTGEKSKYTWYFNGSVHATLGLFINLFTNNEMETKPGNREFFKILVDNEAANLGISSLGLNSKQIISITFDNF